MSDQHDTDRRDEDERGKDDTGQRQAPRSPRDRQIRTPRRDR